MEVIRGKQSSCTDAGALATKTAGYQGIWVDIGTGDGRYVRHIARECPAWFVIGIDACRENLRDVSRGVPRNALFIIANALTLPRELDALATRITINFPWGSLLTALVDGDPALFASLRTLARPGTDVEILLNRSVLREAGHAHDDATVRIRNMMWAQGFAVIRSEPLGTDALRACPTTWAKRLARGHDPFGWYICGVACTEMTEDQSARVRVLE